MANTGNTGTRKQERHVLFLDPAELARSERLAEQTGLRPSELARQIYRAGLTWAENELAPRLQQARAALAPQTAGGPR